MRFRQFALLSLLLAFVALAGWYSVAIPLGEGPDEPGHAEFAFFLARNGRLPDQRNNEVPGEGHQPPLAYLLLRPLAAAAPPAERRVVLTSNPKWIWAGGDQAAAFAWRTLDRWPYAGGIGAWHAMRLVSVLCGALTVLLTFAIARRAGLAWPIAFGAAALLAAWPQFIFHSALVSNDPLLWLLTAATVWLLLDPRPGRAWPALLGGVIGAALLTKQSAIILIPLAALALWMRRRESSWPGRRSGAPRAPRVLGMAAISAAVALLLTGWWFLRNLLLYGDLFGLTAYRGEFASPTFSPFRLGDWGEAARLLGSSLIARFGWMSVPAPIWLYYAGGGIGLAGAIGLLIALRRRSAASQPPRTAPAQPPSRGPQGRNAAARATRKRVGSYPKGSSKRGDTATSPAAQGIAGLPASSPPVAFAASLAILGGLVLLALAWTIAFAIISGMVGWQARFVLIAAPALAIGLAIGLARIGTPLGNGAAGLWLALALLAATDLALPAAMIAPAYPKLVVAQQPDRPLLARWAPDLTPPIELRGLDLPSQAQRGRELLIGTLWHALGPQDRNWTLFIHLVKPGDRYETFSNDSQPQGGEWPALRWTAGDWWEDATVFTVPADLPPGPYDVRMGWFDERDGLRIGLRSPDGVLLGDYATVGRIEVAP